MPFIFISFDTGDDHENITPMFLDLSLQSPSHLSGGRFGNQTSGQDRLRHNGSIIDGWNMAVFSGQPRCPHNYPARELQWLLDGLSLEQREAHPPARTRAVGAAPSKLLPDKSAPMRYPKIVHSGKALGK